MKWVPSRRAGALSLPFCPGHVCIEPSAPAYLRRLEPPFRRSSLSIPWHSISPYPAIRSSSPPLLQWLISGWPSDLPVGTHGRAGHWWTPTWTQSVWPSSRSGLQPHPKLWRSVTPCSTTLPSAPAPRPASQAAPRPGSIVSKSSKRRNGLQGERAHERLSKRLFAPRRFPFADVSDLASDTRVHAHGKNIITAVRAGCFPAREASSLLACAASAIQAAQTLLATEPCCGALWGAAAFRHTVKHAW